MRSPAIALLLAATLTGTVAMAEAASAPPPGTPVMEDPEILGQYFGNGDFAALESTVVRYVKSPTRTVDGKDTLYELMYRFDKWWYRWASGADQTLSESLAEWRKKYPESALQPMAAAMQVYATAWRARGTGSSASVADEGWRLFHERSARAWKILMDCKERSSSIPTWYELAIRTGIDSGVSADRVRELFDEGMRKHPGYYGLYMTYIRPLSPRWGGDYETADEFVLEQTAAKSNREGDILYARLYTRIDFFQNSSPDFFRDSKVNWPRLRRGFEQMMAAYPNSALNHATFAAFACRAGDATTYAKLRPKIDAVTFDELTPQGLSLEICDARFMKET
jgi:hypothetical protein